MPSSSKPFIPSTLEDVCHVEVPQHLLKAWSDPYQFLLTACTLVVIVASVPMVIGIWKRLKNLFNKKKLRKATTPSPEDGNNTTVINPLMKLSRNKGIHRGDIETGPIEDIKISESSPLTEDAEAAEYAGRPKKDFKNSDHASKVFFNLVSLAMVMTAFGQCELDTKAFTTLCLSSHSFRPQTG